ncbi:hypothetical protein Verru16b_00818 [Lacunisphaera limnophila]|uniref:PEP-CTERM protein-sorting domain-containing protein n=1 Tax=Lacunisphaera limnophila TaxID=1838286 RepID=A0A1D8ASC5_9BACT|nr:PEP-CTERM sorting domain-containing protein [Lacunisphaera limnophila]AOS43762.1 hypothetical protein Verru16b_00818 [Lacunisphaera limnophila]
MKTGSSRKPNRARLLPSRWQTVVLAGLFQAVNLSAQVAVTGITYDALVDNANTSSGGITYLNRDREVSTVVTGLGSYRFDGPLADNVFFRRNTDSNGNGTANQAADNPNNSTIIYQHDGSNRHYGEYESSLEQLFLDGNLYGGLRNPFGNGAGTSTNSNIERIDFNFAGGYTVQADDALVFFDVENLGSFGDGFRIAAYTSVGTVNGFSNAPTAYANTGLLVAPDSFGGPVNNPQGGASGNYRRATFTNGDSLAGTASGITSVGELQLVGILIRFADLGITAGTTIQGYSLLAGDTAPTTAASLVNWNDATYYPTNTDPAGYGNMDFMGFGAQISRPVPEPSTYGAILVALGLAWVGVRRLIGRHHPQPS